MHDLRQESGRRVQSPLLRASKFNGCSNLSVPGTFRIPRILLLEGKIKRAGEVAVGGGGGGEAEWVEACIVKPD